MWRKSGSEVETEGEREREREGERDGGQYLSKLNRLKVINDFNSEHQG